MALVAEVQCEMSVDSENYDRFKDIDCSTAIEYRKMEVILRSDNGRVNSRGDTLLHYAVLHGDRNFCELLLHKGVDKNAINRYNITPRELALVRGEKEIAGLLAGTRRKTNPIDWGSVEVHEWLKSLPGLKEREIVMDVCMKTNMSGRALRDKKLWELFKEYLCTGDFTLILSYFEELLSLRNDNSYLFFVDLSVIPSPDRSCFHCVLDTGVPGIWNVAPPCLNYVKHLIEEGPLGLTEDQIFSLCIYSWHNSTTNREDNFYYHLNNALRNLQHLPKFTGYLYYFFSALKELKATQCKVYRAIPEPEEDIYQIGHQVRWTAISSTSQDKNQALKFNQNNGLMFEIDVLEGRCIDLYSRYPKEKEVLLPPNSIFKVTSRKYQDGVDWVIMEEVKISVF